MLFLSVSSCLLMFLIIDYCGVFFVYCCLDCLSLRIVVYCCGVFLIGSYCMCFVSFCFCLLIIGLVA